MIKGRAWSKVVDLGFEELSFGVKQEKCQKLTTFLPVSRRFKGGRQEKLPSVSRPSDVLGEVIVVVDRDAFGRSFGHNNDLSTLSKVGSSARQKNLSNARRDKLR